MSEADIGVTLGPRLIRLLRELVGGAGGGRRPAFVPQFVTPVPKGAPANRSIGPVAGSIDFDYRIRLQPPLDRDGNPTKYGSPVAWESTTPELADFEVETEDGMTAIMRTKAPGTVGYRLSADMDPGDADREASGEFTFDLQAGGATGFLPEGFTPIPKPETPAA